VFTVSQSQKKVQDQSLYNNSIHGWKCQRGSSCCSGCSIQLQDHDSVLVEGTCQIPDPLYKLIGSIVCFYIPLGVMLLTYALTVRLLAFQQQNVGGGGAGWSSGWLGPSTPSIGNKRVLKRLAGS
jgi:hypothetical protein